MSDLHSVKAPDAPETKTRTFRVLQLDESTINTVRRWTELKTLSTVYRPEADEVGEAYGEGRYMLVEVESDYSFHHVYPMHVVADRVYRLADEDES